MRETRAEQLIKGILILFVTSFFVNVFGMRAMQLIMTILFDNGLLIIIVLFQPELRRVLERMGRGKLKSLSKGLISSDEYDILRGAADSLVRVCAELGRTKTGAIIVIEGNTMIGEIAATGTVLNADVSDQLLSSIFRVKSPLHDGAVIIRAGRIHAAGCILPLSENDRLDAGLGTRHRAAVGVTEISDALTIVVSEETGIISVAKNGVLERGFNSVTLKEQVEKAVFGDVDAEKSKHSVLSRTFGIFKTKKEKKDETE